MKRISLQVLISFALGHVIGSPNALAADSAVPSSPVIIRCDQPFMFGFGSWEKATTDFPTRPDGIHISAVDARGGAGVAGLNVNLATEENDKLNQIDLDRAATTRWQNKKVLASRLLDDMENPATWTLQHRGQLSFTNERCRDGQQSVRITVPTLSDQPNKVHGRSFGEATLSRHFQNEDWTDFNRLSFWVYPTMKGFKNGSMLAKLIDDGSDQEKDTFSPCVPGTWPSAIPTRS